MFSSNRFLDLLIANFKGVYIIFEVVYTADLYEERRIGPILKYEGKTIIGCWFCENCT